MARTPTTGLTPVELAPLDGERLTEQQNTAALMEQAFSEEQRRVTLLIGERIGRRSMAQMVTKLLTVSDLLDLQRIKESKEYRGFVYIDEQGNRQSVSTWDEYCTVVEERSRQTIDLELQNLNQLGEELFDSMRRVGIGPGKMREIRRLPEDAKTALIEVAKSGDKESFIELAEEIISKHAKEKETLSKELEETRADYAAQGELMARKSAELDATRLELEKARQRIQTLPADEAVKEFRLATTAITTQVEADVLVNLRTAFSTLLEQPGEVHDHRAWMAGQVRQLRMAIARLVEEFELDLADDGEQLPDWLRTTELAPGAGSEG